MRALCMRGHEGFRTVDDEPEGGLTRMLRFGGRDRAVERAVRRQAGQRRRRASSGRGGNCAQAWSSDTSSRPGPGAWNAMNLSIMPASGARSLRQRRAAANQGRRLGHHAVMSSRARPTDPARGGTRASGLRKRRPLGAR